MTLLVLSVLAWLAYRWYRKVNPHEGNELGPIVGRATHYDQCPGCNERDTQSARGHGEVITRGGFYVVRQYHICQNCGIKALWHRRLDQFTWTIRRNGMPQ